VVRATQFRPSYFNGLRLSRVLGIDTPSQNSVPGRRPILIVDKAESAPLKEAARLTLNGELCKPVGPRIPILTAKTVRIGILTHCLTLP